MRNKKHVVAILISMIILLLACGCGKKAPAEDQSSHIFVMGTVFEVRAIGSGAAEHLKEAGQVLYDCDRQISWRQEGSLADTFNQMHQADMSEIDALIETGLQICSDSRGAFDLTVLPLSKVWDFNRMSEADFDPEQMTVPDEAAISEALSRVGYQKLDYDQETHQLTAADEDVQIELGAIGKGYAADQAAAALKRAGLSAGMVNAGSTISVFGNKPDGSGFNVAVRNPRGEADDYIGVLTLTDTSIATSGDYERFFEQDGIRYHHILDPHTGYPADAGLIQVTIICDNGMLADALSTACFVLGLEDGMALADQYDAMALFVDSDRQVWYSSSDILDCLTFSGEEKGYTLHAYE